MPRTRTVAGTLGPSCISTIAPGFSCDRVWSRTSSGDVARQSPLRTLQPMFASEQQVAPFGGFADLGTLTMVPEPGTWAMLMAGLGVLAVAASRRRAGTTDQGRNRACFHPNRRSA